MVNTLRVTRRVGSLTLGRPRGLGGLVEARLWETTPGASYRREDHLGVQAKMSAA
jgi:hypothetical protein